MIDRVLQLIERKRDYKETFGTPHGERVLKHILEVAGVTRPKFTTNAERLVWNEAQRHFAMSIFRQVHGSMDKLPDYITEQIKQTEDEQ
jgi:hypothetical protein